MDVANMYPGLVFAGLLVGILIGTVGVGGGSVMTPILIQVFAFSPTIAIAVDLIFALTTKLFAINLHRKQNGLDITVVKYVGGFGVLGALVGSALFSIAHSNFPAEFDSIIKLIIGIALLAGAITNLYIRYHQHSQVQVLNGFRSKRLSMAIVGFIVGGLVSTTSVGAGALIMIFLLHFWHVPMEKVVGTDLTIAVIIIAVASFSHAFSVPIDWFVVAALIAGGLVGVTIGERLHRHLNKDKLKIVVTILLAVVGLVMIFR